MKYVNLAFCLWSQPTKSFRTTFPLRQVKKLWKGLDKVWKKLIASERLDSAGMDRPWQCGPRLSAILEEVAFGSLLEDGTLLTTPSLG